MLSPRELSEAIKAVYRKAATDAAFRQRCLDHPHAAMKEATGLEIPDELKIRFAETPDERVFVLPPLGASELSEGELEEIAGGNAWASAWGTECTAYLGCA